MSFVRRKLLLAALVGSLLGAQAAPAQADGESYVVARGENLFRVALTHGTTVARLMELNGIRDPALVYAGQRLLLPPAERPATSTATPTAPAHSQNPPAAGGKPAPATSPVPTIIHVVAPGQNLYRISLQYDIPYTRIMEANGLASPDFVWAGQQLVIPAAGAITPERREPVAPPKAAAPPPAPQPASQAAERPADSSPPPSAKPRSEEIPSTPLPGGTQGGLVHEVEPGQNLYRIALKYGVSWPLLQQANGLASADRIATGQRLVIRAGGASVRAAPPPPTPPSLVTRPAGLFRLTFYCLVGPMSSGRWVYPGAAAADQSIFRLGTVVSVQDFGVYTIEDRFAWDAREQRLDIWVPTCVEAIRLGVMHKLVSVLAP